MPYYIEDPKRDPAFDNHSYTLGSGLGRDESAFKDRPAEMFESDVSGTLVWPGGGIPTGGA